MRYQAFTEASNFDKSITTRYFAAQGKHPNCEKTSKDHFLVMHAQLYCKKYLI